MVNLDKNIFTDKEIVEGIQAGGKEEDECLDYLYKDNYNMIVNYIKTNSGDEEDAKEFFQESIIVFYERVKNGEYTLDAKISTYLFEVVKRKWMNELKRRKRIHEHAISNTSLEMEDQLDSVLIQKEKKQKVMQFINALHPTCRKILLYFYFQELSMKRIAELMGFKNDQVARNRKNLCMNELKDIICGKENLEFSEK